MEDGLKLTKKDIKKYRKEIDDIDLMEKEIILARSAVKISSLLGNSQLDKFQLILLQEINALYNILIKSPNLEELVQQKILFALKYFLQGKDDIPDGLPTIGYLDDLAIVDWVIQDIKEQYSHYFQA